MWKDKVEIIQAEVKEMRDDIISFLREIFGSHATRLLFRRASFKSQQASCCFCRNLEYCAMSHALWHSELIR